MLKFLILLLFFFLSGLAQAQSDTDQWKNSEQTYKDLINDGFEIKSYDTTSINSKGGLTILLFITVLQKNKEVFECQEYQTLDKDMNTLDMSLLCRELTQPYQRGIGT
jgi:endo-1,4-beta-D-glucanase Y